MSLKSVEVSVYGASAQTYEAVTGVPGSYARFREGLRHLARARVPARLKTVLLGENIDEWPKLKRMYARRFKLSCGLDVSLRFDGERDPAAHRASSAQIAAMLYRGGASRTSRGKRLAGGSDIVCDLARRGCVVSAYGDVFACGMLPVSGGNLREKSFSSIWESSSFLQEVRGLSLRDLDGCGECDALPYCRPCWGLNYLETGDMRKPSPESCRIARLRRFAARSRVGSQAGR
jgi:radical SAM protein with 4Fe4S-binding SPASM domain